MHIKIDNKSLFNKDLYCVGVTYIGDILNKNGRFMSNNEIYKKYSVRLTNYYYMSLIDAIPSEWRKKIKSSHLVPICPKEEAIFLTLKNKSKPINLVKSKEIYWYLNDKNKCTPTCIKSWNDKYDINFTDLEWKHIFSLPISITADTKLREFQFKIIHRAYATDSVVSNFDASVEKNCKICHKKNNIIHLFVECSKVDNLWKEFIAWYNRIESQSIKLTAKDIIFGCLRTNMPIYLNFCILHLKWFIHTKRKEDLMPYFVNYLHYLEHVLQVEEARHIRNNDKTHFDRHYAKITNHCSL
jgi:hypothetical protein